jgi:hypothetical protein
MNGQNISYLSTLGREGLEMHLQNERDLLHENCLNTARLLGEISGTNLVRYRTSEHSLENNATVT